jgi:hypothetical protein
MAANDDWDHVRARIHLAWRIRRLSSLDCISKTDAARTLVAPNVQASFSDVVATS